MNQPEFENLTSQHCPAENLSAYVDGELSPAEELEIINHTRSCSTCADLLREHQRMLNGLESSFESFEIPADFARQVIVKAETSFDSRRLKRDRIPMIAFAILLLFVCVSASGDTSAVIKLAAATVERVTIAVSFVAYFIYGTAFGVAVIARSVANVFEPSHFALATAAIAAAIGSGLFYRFPLRGSSASEK